MYFKECYDMLYDVFVYFLLYTVEKYKIIDQNNMTNYATASPIHYYSLASWFIVIIVWLLLIYNFLYQEETIRMKERMKLYGVTELQQQFSKMIVTLVVILPLSVGMLFIFNHLLNFLLDQDD